MPDSTPAYLTSSSIDHFIRTALAEDIGDGDHSTLASVPAHAHRQARLLVKDNGILAGMALAPIIFHTVDSALEVTPLLADGETVQHGAIGLTVSGKAQSILQAERLVLNCMQRMSGIATYTRQLVQLIAHTKAQLLDTRKTTPNFRLMEKWAVAIGGGHNHRFGLFDMIILKDNHIDYAGGVASAILATHQYLKVINKDLQIVVETRNLREVEEVLRIGGITRIMLDNMPPEKMREAIDLIDGRFPTEASGGITEHTIVAVAESGVDYISVGALTHSVKSLDISLKAV